MEEDLAGRLRQLAELRASGALTEEEFTTAKAYVLHPPSAGGRDDAAPLVAEPAAATPQVQGPLPPEAPQAGESSGPQNPVYQTGMFARPAWLPAEHGVPPAPSPAGSAGRGAAVTMGIGGLVALLAFFAMPLGVVPFLGSITGSTLAGLSSEEGALGLLWLVPVAAVTVVAIAGWLLFGDPADARARRGAGWVIGLGVAVVLAYLIALAALQKEISDSGGSSIGVAATDLIGPGFWFTLIGMVTASIGAGAQLRSSGF